MMFNDDRRLVYDTTDNWHTNSRNDVQLIKYFARFQADYEKYGFHWNEIEQGRVLGSYYWLHWILQLPGGILGRRYGAKMVFGMANFLGTFLGFFMPIASYYGVNWLIFLRVLQGLITVLITMMSFIIIIIASTNICVPITPSLLSY